VRPTRRRFRDANRAYIPDRRRHGSYRVRLRIKFGAHQWRGCRTEALSVRTLKHVLRFAAPIASRSTDAQSARSIYCEVKVVVAPELAN